LRQTIIVFLLLATFPSNAQWLYSISDKNGSPMLQRVNIHTYEVVDIVSLWPREYSDIAFNSSGKLYGIDNETIDRIYEIDTLTGISTLVYTFMDGSDVVGMTIDRNDVFYLTGESPNGVPELKSLNLSSGIPETISRLESGYNSINDCVFYEGNLYCCALGLPNEVERGVLLKMDTSEMELHKEAFRYEKWPGHALASFNTKCKGDYLISPVSEQLNFFNFSDTSVSSVPIFTSPWVFQSGGATSLTSWMGSLPALTIDSLIIHSDPCIDLSTITVIPKHGRTGIRYAIDTSSFQPDSIFGNVLSDLHTISIQDDRGCVFTSEPFDIIKPDLDSFFTPHVIEATCGENNGQIAITDYLNVINTEYSLNGINWQNQNNFSNLSGGVYKVFIRLPFGCIDSLNVSVPSGSTIDLIATTSPEHCGKKDGYIEIEVIGGQPPYNFSLSNGLNFTDLMIDSLLRGNYQLSVVDIVGCTKEIDVVVSELTFEIDSLSIKNEICNNSNGAVGITVEGETDPYSYSLDFGLHQDSSFFFEIASGVHTLFIEDVFGCVVDTSFTISNVNSPPIFEVEQTNANCNLNNGSVLVNNESINDLVSLNLSPFESSHEFDSLPPGLYTIIVLNSLGCKDTTAISINQEGTPEITNQLVSPEHCDNADGTIEILNAVGGEPPYQFALDGGQYSFSRTFQNINAGPHTVSIIDFIGCTDTVTIFVDQVSGPAIQSLIVVPSNCTLNDGQIHIQATGNEPVIYSLKNIDNISGLFNGLAPGKYSILVKDVFECQESVEVLVAHENEFSIESLDVLPSLCNKANGRFSVTSSEDVFISVEEVFQQNWTNVATGLLAGTYHVSLSNQAGCQFDTLVTIPTSCEIYLPNVFSPNGDNINDVFGEIHDVSISHWELEIFDRAGNLVFRSKDPSKGWKGEFKEKECMSGVYVWRLKYKFTSKEEAKVLNGDVTIIR